MLPDINRLLPCAILCVLLVLEAAESQSSHAGHVPSTEDFEQRCLCQGLCSFSNQVSASNLNVSFKPVQEWAPDYFHPFMWNLKTLLFFEFEDDLELSMSNSSLSNPCKSTLLTGVAGNFILGPWWCLNQPAKRVQVGNLVRTLLAMAMALSLFLHSWLCGHFSPRAPALPYTSKSTMVLQWLRRFLANGASK